MELERIICSVVYDVITGRWKCDGRCEGEAAMAIPGEAPPDYLKKYARLLKKRDWALRQGVLREGCHGRSYPDVTLFPGFPVSDEERTRSKSVVVRRGMSDVRKAAVLAHECAHVLLKHPTPEGNRRALAEVHEQAYRMGIPFTEQNLAEIEPVSNEFPAELAAAAVSVVTRGVVDDVSYHYLTDRMRHYRVTISEENIQDALKAATIITEEVL